MFAASHLVYTVCSGLSDQIHTVKYMVRVMLRQTGKIMAKSSVITNRLSIAMSGPIIEYLLSSDLPALLIMHSLSKRFKCNGIQSTLPSNLVMEMDIITRILVRTWKCALCQK